MWSPQKIQKPVGGFTISLKTVLPASKGTNPFFLFHQLLLETKSQRPTQQHATKTSTKPLKAAVGWLHSKQGHKCHSHLWGSTPPHSYSLSTYNVPGTSADCQESNDKTPTSKNLHSKAAMDNKWTNKCLEVLIHKSSFNNKYIHTHTHICSKCIMCTNGGHIQYVDEAKDPSPCISYSTHMEGFNAKTQLAGIALQLSLLTAGFTGGTYLSAHWPIRKYI